jgi:hypothetical protein
MMSDENHLLGKSKVNLLDKKNSLLDKKVNQIDKQ